MTPHTGIGCRRAVVALVLAAGLAGGTRPAQAATAPDFRTVTAAGDTVQLSSFRGRIVLVDFWATWCPPCREQLERWAALEKEIPGLVVLAVNVDTRRDKLGRYAKNVRLPRRVLLDPGGRIAGRYAVEAMPWTVLVDERGEIVWARGGFAVKEWPQIESEVRRLVGRASAD